MSEPIIDVQGVSKIYRKGSLDVPALQQATFTVRQGEFVSIMGRSGSGKSTLLYLLGCLVRPTSGIYRLAGRDVTRLPGRELASVRCHRIGFVFQSFHLLAGLSALRNVEMPALYDGRPRAERRARARWQLERVGLGQRLDHRPMELSGGEAQRVAIARALMNDPALILADEPTGNLDSATGREIMALLAELRGEGRTVVLVTHDAEISQCCDRVLRIRDGVLVEG